MFLTFSLFPFSACSSPISRKTIFLDKEGAVCRNFQNIFLEVTEATEFVHVQSEVLIAGKSTKVTKIMLFKQSWLDAHFMQPMKRNVSRIERSMIASKTNHCLHCAGNTGRCACSSCPQTTQSKCSQTLSFSGLIDALAQDLEQKKKERLDHCLHCKGLESTCGCEHGCTRPSTSTCIIEHSTILCDACHTQGIRGARYKCVDCPNYDLCGSCYSSNKHDLTHAFNRTDRVGCTPIRLAPRKPRAAAPLPRGNIADSDAQQATSSPGSSSAVQPEGFFYLNMSVGQLKRYLHENGVTHNDCFELDDIRRRAWECYCDNMSGSELVAFMAKNDINGSGCRNISARRERLKAAFRAAERPKAPIASFKVGQSVVLHGLKRADMNGKQGIILDPNPTPERAKIQIDNVRNPMLVKYENLLLDSDLLD